MTAIIGLAVERVLIRPLYGRDPLYSLLLTFGLAFIIEDGTRFISGAQGKPVTIPTFLAQPLSNDLFFITGYRLFMVAVVMIAVALLFLLLRHTRLGVRIRAGTLDLETSPHSVSTCRCWAHSISASAFIWRVSAACSPPDNWGLSRPWALLVRLEVRNALPNLVAQIFRWYRRRFDNNAGHGWFDANALPKRSSTSTSR